MSVRFTALRNSVTRVKAPGLPVMRKRFIGTKAKVLRSVSSATSTTHVETLEPSASAPSSTRPMGSAKTAQAVKSTRLSENAEPKSVVASVFRAWSVSCS